MTDQSISPLRRRMIEDMNIRKMAPKTQSTYIRAVTNFAVFLGRSPERAGPEDLWGRGCPGAHTGYRHRLHGPFSRWPP